MLLSLFACSPPAPVAPHVIQEPKPDVVIITLDTTRADHLGAYGYAGGKTDTIDRLAKEGLVFKRAYSPLPLTIPAHASMFTGLYPFHHNVRNNGDNVLAPEFDTLAEILQSNGWATAASAAAFVTTRQWGFAQGFDAYFDSMPEQDEGSRNFWHTERPADQVVDDALAWLAQTPADKPVFLWVHLYDAHYPYHLRGEYAETYKDKPYDGEIAFVDDQIQRLVDVFAGRSVLWSLVGDHGEGLGDHDETAHGSYNYDTTAHVPWIVSGAGVPAGVYDAPVSTVDLTPTLLHMLGIPVPTGLDGHPQPGGSTVPYAESYLLSDRLRLAPHRTVVQGPLKLIATPKPELYDVVADPGELINLAAQRPDDVIRLKAVLDGLGANPPTARKTTLDADTLAQLAALGYMGGAGDDGIDPLTLPDAKDFPELMKGIAAFDRPKSGPPSPTQSLAEVDTLLAMKADAYDLRMRRLPLLAQLGRTDEASLFAIETAEMFPSRPRVWTTLAGMANRERDYTTALEYARKAVATDPTDASSREVLVETLLLFGKTEEGLAEAEAALAVDAKNYGVAALLGQHYLKLNDFANAEKNLRMAIAGPNPRRAARAQLALLALAAGVRNDAYALLEAEVKDYPGNQRARRLLAKLLGDDQRWDDQREQLAFLARSNPNDVKAIRALGQCLFNLQDYAAARGAVDAALELDSADPDVMLLNANLLSKEGRQEEAVAMAAAANAANALRVERLNAEAAAKAKAAPAGAKGAAPLKSAPKKEK